MKTLVRILAIAALICSLNSCKMLQQYRIVEFRNGRNEAVRLEPNFDFDGAVNAHSYVLSPQGVVTIYSREWNYKTESLNNWPDFGAEDPTILVFSVETGSLLETIHLSEHDAYDHYHQITGFFTTYKYIVGTPMEEFLFIKPVDNVDVQR